MIPEEELIKHKWKYIPESNTWRKLGVTFKDRDRASNYYNLYFGNFLSSFVHTPTLYDLERLIKMGVSTIFSHKKYQEGLSIKQKRTFKNWIL